jgi:beta-lactam-binding protein with PASTA domain
MPMVVGLDLSMAREVISSAITDPQVSIEYKDTDVVPPGTVFVQEPPAGRHISPGSQIRLTVSTRPTAEDLSSSEP